MQDICLRNIIYKVEKRFSDTPLLIFHGRSKIKKTVDAHDLQVDFPVLFLIHLRNLIFGIISVNKYLDILMNIY